MNVRIMLNIIVYSTTFNDVYEWASFGALSLQELWVMILALDGELAS